MMVLPELRRTMRQQAAASCGNERADDLTRCPACGHIRFYATNRVFLIEGKPKQLRACFGCGYRRAEDAPDAKQPNITDEPMMMIEGID